MQGVKQVEFRPRKVEAEFCTVCNQFLTGNGSLIMPWTCGCGVYRFSWKLHRYIHPKNGGKKSA